MPGTLNNCLILRDKYIRDTTAIALSEGDLKEQLVEVRAQLAVAVAALKKVEHVGTYDHDGTRYEVCPWCGWHFDDDILRNHAPDCQRQAALRLCGGGDDV